MLSKSVNLATMSSASLVTPAKVGGISSREKSSPAVEKPKMLHAAANMCDARASSKKASAAFILFFGSVGTFVQLMEFFSWNSEPLSLPDFSLYNSFQITYRVGTGI